MKLLKYLCIFAVIGTTATSWGVPIIQASNQGGNTGTDNVLFNVLGGTGNTIQGSINSNPGFTVNFTSSEVLEAGGGQATLLAAGGGTYDDVVFSLADGATFTKLIFNIDSDATGQVQFSISYFDTQGQLFNSLQNVGANGSNFFQIIAAQGEVISSVSLVGVGDVDFTDINQWRVGGLQRAQGVPDGGASVALLGLAMSGMAWMRRKA